MTATVSATSHIRRRIPGDERERGTRARIPSEVFADIQALTAPCVLTKTKERKTSSLPPLREGRSWRCVLVAFRVSRDAGSQSLGCLGSVGS